MNVEEENERILLTYMPFSFSITIVFHRFVFWTHKSTECYCSAVELFQPFHFFNIYTKFENTCTYIIKRYTNHVKLLHLHDCILQHQRHRTITLRNCYEYDYANQYMIRASNITHIHTSP